MASNINQEHDIESLIARPKRNTRKRFVRVEALVYWLWVMTTVRKVVGLNPRAIYRMDIFQIDLL